MPQKEDEMAKERFYVMPVYAGARQRVRVFASREAAQGHIDNQHYAFSFIRDLVRVISDDDIQAIISETPAQFNDRLQRAMVPGQYGAWNYKR